MMKIDSLMAEQSAKLIDYRDRYFAQATSTAPADRPCAEAAARRLAEIGGIQVQRAIWVADPREGKMEVDAECNSLWDPLRAPLRASLWASLRNSLLDSLRASLWDSLFDSPWCCYYSAARDVFGIQYEASASEQLRLFEEIAGSCFALWVMPSAVILCERPMSVQIEGEGAARKLTGITFRSE